MQWNPAVWVNDSRQFLLEVRTEFRKVTWPTQKEALAGTIGTLVVCIIVTLVLSAVNAVASRVMQWILS